MTYCCRIYYATLLKTLAERKNVPGSFEPNNRKRLVSAGKERWQGVAT